MRAEGWTVLSLFLTAMILAVSASPPPSVTVDLHPLHGSKISGTATIVHGPKQIDVSITLDGVFIPENSYPAGVYAGTCAKLGASPVYPLTPVIGGRSVTHLDASRMKHDPPQPGPYAIAVFNTAGTQATWCGALPAMHHKPSMH